MAHNCLALDFSAKKRERKKETDRERERDRQRQTDRERGRQVERGRQRERQTDRGVFVCVCVQNGLEGVHVIDLVLVTYHPAPNHTETEVVSQTCCSTLLLLVHTDTEPVSSSNDSIWPEIWGRYHGVR